MANIIFLETVQDYGGARKSTVELASRLLAYHNVEIIDVNGTCQPFIEACQKASIPLTILDKRDTPLILSSTNLLTKVKNYIYFWAYSRKINKSLNNTLDKYEECYVIVNNSKVLTYLLNKPKGAKIVLFARGWFVKQQISKIDFSLYKRLVDKYIAVSESTRQAIYGAQLASLQDITVVHNAIETTLRSPKAQYNNRAIRILFSGGFLPTKGQLTAIGIAQKLKERNIDFEMILTGIIYQGEVSQNFYKQIVNLIRESGLEDRIKIVVNHNNISEYFEWCDIFCHPSDTEGLPRVVMEAMSFGKPVIANAVGGVTDYILNGYTGFITRHNNIDDYVSAIIKLKEDQTIYNKIAKRAYEVVTETFTANLQIEQLNSSLE